MVCTFFGHRDTSLSIEPILRKRVEELIVQGVERFYIGNNGNFDFMARRVLKEMKKAHSHIRYDVVLSSLSELAKCEDTSDTVFPEGLEKSLPRFAVAKRNEWMLARCDIVVAYVHAPGGAKKYVDAAEKKGKRVINLAEFLL